MRPHRVAAAAAVGCLALGLAGCNTTNQYGVTASPRLVQAGQPVPSGGGNYKVGKPYRIAGRTYTPREEPGYDEVGLASWYGSDFHGRQTANGEIFDSTSLSAAHPTLPMPTYARVTNLDNGRSVVVRINDRGPFAHNRLIDLSKRSAELLDFKHHGTAKVRVQYVGAAPLEGNDGEWLTTTVRNDGAAVAPVMMASSTIPVPQPAPTVSPAAVSATSPTGGSTGARVAASGYAGQPSSSPGTATTSMGFSQPVSGNQTPATVPLPQAPVGGKVTYRWVQGYVPAAQDADLVARTFGLFEPGADMVVVIGTRAGADAPARTWR